MKPKSIYISLTPEQLRLLKPHFDYVRQQYVLGRPGMLIAQVWQMQDDYAEDVP